MVEIGAKPEIFQAGDGTDGGSFPEKLALLDCDGTYACVQRGRLDTFPAFSHTSGAGHRYTTDAPVLFKPYAARAFTRLVRRDIFLDAFRR